MPRHFIDLLDLSPAEARRLIDQSIQLKRDEQRGRAPATACRAGRSGCSSRSPRCAPGSASRRRSPAWAGMRSSCAARTSGWASARASPTSPGCSSQYVDALAVRTFSHATVEELAGHATIPVINALSDASHPCQAMADLMTIEELRGTLAGQKLVFVGDGNNVARSLAAASALLGVEFVLAAPPGYEFPADFQARFAAKFPGVPLVVERDPQTAVDGRRRGLHRRLGQHGPGARGRQRGAGLRAVPGQRRLAGPRQARRRSSSTACPRTAARK